MSGSVLTSGFIPREPEEISAEWLFEVINQYRTVKDLSQIRHPDDLVNCEIVERKNSHAYTSSTYIITVHFKCFTTMGMEQCKYCFFLKLLPSATIAGCESGFKLARSCKYFQREIEAHFRVLTHLKSVWSSRSQTGNHVWTSLDITTPEIVYGSYNESGDGVIVLIDVTQCPLKGLAPSNFNPVDHYRGLSLSQIMSTVEHLSVIHASATAVLIQDKADDRLTQLSHESPDKHEVLTGEVSSLLRLFGRFLKIVPGYREQAEVFEKHRPILVNMATRALKRPTTFPLKTAIHGELWDRNLLFRRKLEKLPYVNPHQEEINKVDFEPGRESSIPGEDRDAATDVSALEVMFTDWKNLSLASPSHDLVSLLFTSTTKSTRELHGRHILEKYYLCFTECLRTKFDINVSQLYPEFDFDVFSKDFESSTFPGFLQAACLMTRELRYLETEFSFIKPEKVDEKEKAGEDLRQLGRRILELADEFVPMIGTAEWKKILAQNSSIVVIKS